MNTFRRLDNLNGQVVVITGGVGQIGFATANRLAQQGARIVAIVRKNLSEAQNKMQSLPKAEELKHFAVEASVTDSLSLAKARDEIKKQAGRCDILINTASVTKNVKPDNFDELTDELFDQIITTNLRGTYATIRTFVPLLKESGNGLIINLSSTASLRASNSNVAYACAKAGINMMTRTLAKVLAPEVRIIAIAPGHLVNPTSGAVKSATANDTMAATSPLKRIGYADDIASTIEAYATSIRFATGTVVVVDGGRTI